MKTIQFKMYVSTRYVGSESSDIGEIEIDGTETEEQIESMIEEYTRDWMFDQIEWGYTRDEVSE